ncbi:hypothetical protein DACRYDRAFT_23984 [Dacryopinax primogenitus]|uniref:GH16 domain-containing protein n=1 Tax=Dacryopinax primogenitus (strain DJM 731) TaxID=1858805 RepID=M5FZ51_DACPD|nr:uncharacterized protein DACRYDRAFT_23984 [Dacryopinax primogenitus]EJT98851.1 hypothetical protein DACRYDRAFT_23984 [Dacryopinax primogenitus]
MRISSSTLLFLSLLTDPVLSITLISPSLHDLARSVAHGAHIALQHSNTLISSTAHLLGHHESAAGLAPGQRGKRVKRAAQSCVVRGGQVPLGAGEGGNATTTAPTGLSPGSPASGSSSESPASGSASISHSSAGTTTPNGPSSVSSAGPTTSNKPSSVSSAAPAESSAAASSDPAGWNLVQTYAGTSFFDGWDFWTDSDPTHGTVTYVSQSAADSLGLVSTSDTSAIMRVSTAQPLPSGYTSRPSIRITTQRSFTGGLLIGDIAHMPTGCGTWPAFWSNGPNWPAGGEIDIIEGVSDATHNTASIHTNPGCTIPTNYGASGVPALAGSEGYNCAAEETNDSGCGLTDNTPNNFGEPFNNVGGGVFAMKWDSTGIAVYFWSRPNVPQDITSSLPNPASWPEPIGAWPASQCNPYQFFSQNVAIFDTTLCGDWAGNAWTTAAYGASQSCAQSTGYSTCAAFVAAQGASFSEAYWEVHSVKLYQQEGMGS